jgi:cytochrome c-type biogenesis protein CcmE
MGSPLQEEVVSSRFKFFIGGVVVVAVVAVLIATSFGASTSDYLTIAQVKALAPDQARDSRVAGAIVPDSINWNTKDVRLTFEIKDATGSLSISYRGPQPDMLVDAVEAVAIGKYNPSAQVFEAEELLMKCPSKYEEKK